MVVEIGPEIEQLVFEICRNRGANAGYNRVTTSSQSRLVSMATTLSSPIPNTSRRLNFQRLSLTEVSAQRRHKGTNTQ